MSRITRFQEIRPFRNGYTIRVRVALSWRPRKFDNHEFDGLHYRLVDETGTPIHAIVDECHYDHMPAIMENGRVYDVSCFGTKKDWSKMKYTAHEAILAFTEKTKFTLVLQDVPEIPQHAFRLLEFEQLPEVADCQTILADLYGCVKAVKSPQEIIVRNKKERETQTDLTIEFIGREELKVSLWGDCAKDFPLKEIMDFHAPVFAVFTSMRLTKYQDRITANSTRHTCTVLSPKIWKSDDYSNEFSKTGDKVRIFGPFSASESFDKVKQTEIKSVSELKRLDPAPFMYKSVFCIAVVLRIVSHKGWWYRCCSAERCYRQVTKKDEHNDKYFCQLHGQQEPKESYRVYVVIDDDDDQTTLCIMDRAAEELFGLPCEELIKQTLFPTEPIVPGVIAAIAGKSYLLEITINQSGDLMLRNATTHGELSKTVEEVSLGLETPEKTGHTKIKEKHSLRMGLFPADAKKKIKSDKDEQPMSSATAATVEEQEKMDMV